MRSLDAVLSLMLVSFIFLIGCTEDDIPVEENAEEVITDVNLIFSPTDGTSSVLASASDPDGEGPESLVVNGDIILESGKSYNLSIDVLNTLGDEEERITEEIREEADEHMFFYSWTAELFSSPTGDGNVDSREDEAVEYVDFDNNSLPLGLDTRWTAGESGSGIFRMILKHQPGGIKSATSTVTDGASDIDLTWNISIQ